MAHTTPEFRRVLNRAIRCTVREIMDGCNECQSVGSDCNNHKQLISDICTNPSKYIEMTERDGQWYAKVKQEYESQITGST